MNTKEKKKSLESTLRAADSLGFKNMFADKHGAVNCPHCGKSLMIASRTIKGSISEFVCPVCKAKAYRDNGDTRWYKTCLCFELLWDHYKQSKI